MPYEITQQGSNQRTAGSWAYLLESLRERASDNYEDFRERARETYGVLLPAPPVPRLLYGVKTATYGAQPALLVGVGIGVGVGVLIAPASGEETRRNIADKVTDFGEKVRERAGSRTDNTGTYGNWKLLDQFVFSATAKLLSAQFNSAESSCLLREDGRLPSIFSFQVSPPKHPQAQLPRDKQ